MKRARKSPRIRQLHLRLHLRLLKSQRWQRMRSQRLPSSPSRPRSQATPISVSKISTVRSHQLSYTAYLLNILLVYADRNNYTLVVDWATIEDDNHGVMWYKFTMIERLLKSAEYDWIWWIDFDTLMTNMGTKIEDIIHDSLYNSSALIAVDHSIKDEYGSMFRTHFKTAQDDSVDPDEIDFLFTADCFPLNAGSMLVRGRIPASSSRKSQLTSYDFLQKVRKYHLETSTQEHQLSEQDCIRDLLFPDENFHEEIPDTRSKSLKAQDAAYAKSHTRMIPQWKINAFPSEIRCYDKDNRGWRKGDLAIHFAGAWAHLQDQQDPTGYLMTKYADYIVIPGERE